MDILYEKVSYDEDCLTPNIVNLPDTPSDSKPPVVVTQGTDSVGSFGDEGGLENDAILFINSLNPNGKASSRFIWPQPVHTQPPGSRVLNLTTVVSG
ncbi:hypothetical protein BC834DRAFT_970006 [Gloeopeniophorella convolvens]|nr:hypothetical protein BC834DRAFT_970006 [Gloeopeniophorella convolvens]